MSVFIGFLPFLFAVCESWVNVLIAVRDRGQESGIIRLSSKTRNCSARSQLRIALVISAYLPNETETLPETVKGMLNQIQPYPRAKVVLVCNGPMPETLGRILQRLQQSAPSQFQIIHEINSRSKAENLNRVKNSITADVIGLFDADSLPAQNLLTRAVASFDRGGQVVQGSKLVRQASGRPVLQRLVQIEAERKFLIDGPARNAIWGVAYLCGSNCFFKNQVFDQLIFREDAFTEDIEASVYLAGEGIEVVVDSSLIVYESAPPTWAAWYQQRKRWAAGWLQMGRRYSGAIGLARHLNGGRARVCWLYLTYGRRLLPGLSMTLGAAMLVSHFVISPPVLAEVALLSKQLVLVLCVAGVCNFVVSLVAHRGLENKSVVRVPAVVCEVMWAFVFVAYEMAKCLVAVAAWTSPPRGWVVTPRGVPRQFDRMSPGPDSVSPPPFGRGSGGGVDRCPSQWNHDPKELGQSPMAIPPESPWKLYEPKHEN